jgi:hypothetical protein
MKEFIKRVISEEKEEGMEFEDIGKSSGRRRNDEECKNNS